MKALRLLSLIIALALLGILAVATLAEEQTLQTNGGCTSAGGYDPACDVDHDGDIDVSDIQLTAGHWNYTGTWTVEPHDHDDRYYTELELQSPAAAIVHWDNLISVPTGLDDGDDDRLAALSCADGQVAKWDDPTAQWVCRDDELGSGGDGDITAVYAGTGLSGGGDANDVTLALDLGYSDGRYVNEGQASSVDSAMIVNGSVTVDDLADGSALSELADDDGPGSGLDADLLDGQQASAFADASHDHLGETWTGNFTPLKIEGDFVGTVFQRNAPLALHNTSNIGADGLQVTSGGDGVHVVSAGGDGMYVEAAGDDGVDVNSAGVDGVFIEHAGDDGLHVCATGTQTSCVYSDQHNGVEIGSAEDHGLYVGSAGWDGVFVDEAGEDGVYVGSAGGYGLFVGSAGNAGVVVDNAGSAGVVVGSAVWDGLNVGSAGGSGVMVSSTGWDGVSVWEAGSPTTVTCSPASNGFEICGAEGDGLFVGHADGNGLNVAGTDLAGYFGGHIQVTDSCAGCVLTTFALNTGDTDLAPGDIVSLAGLRESGVDSVPMLLDVKATNGADAVVGVVSGWAELVTEEEPRPNEIGQRLVPREGAAKPGQYVTVVYSGLAQVKVNGPIQEGMSLVAGTNGSARAKGTLKVQLANGEGTAQIPETAPVIGIALEGLQSGEGLVWALVNVQ
jgi:hypothetical protein